MIHITRGCQLPLRVICSEDPYVGRYGNTKPCGSGVMWPGPTGALSYQGYLIIFKESEAEDTNPKQEDERILPVLDTFSI